MGMKTTVMFVADSEPLTTVPVRLADDESELYTTDNEGKIEFELEPGTHTFHVQRGDEWVERIVHREGHAPLFVVNVNSPETPDLSTMNTLQIDLANLVGDRYVFETVLGRGGMGIVVKAVDRMLNRPVAIKMLSDELQDNEEAQQIFLVEARNLATLSHPNLVAIHDILNVSGRVLMIFEYVLGENVEKQIKRDGPLDEKEVLRIAIQLTRCVAYLHEHDLIHRDLKPANIIMQADGTLKLIDFGLARSLNELYIRGTRVRGTPAYMAPEQVQGIHLTTGTDLYQIGISMYEMLAGELPFTTGDMAYAHVHLDAPPLAEAVPGIDPELAKLVHDCLSKRPQARPESAETFLARLQGIYARIANRDSQPVGLYESSTGPIPSIEVSEPISVVDAEDLSFAEEVTGGSNRGLLILAILGVAALGAALFLWPRSTPDPVAPSATVANGTAVQKPIETPPPEEDIAEIERERPTMVSGTIGTARGLVAVSIASATGQASAPREARVARTDSPPQRQARRRPARRAPAQRQPRAMKPPAAKPRRKTSKSENAAPSRPNSQKKALETTDEATRHETDLLSVDEEPASKTLLPVNE